MEGESLTGISFLFYKMKNSGDLSHNNVNEFNSTELDR
jgi:hypothetical protein